MSRKFTFDAVLVGTDGWRRLFKKLTCLAGKGHEVMYEEYVTIPGRWRVFKPDGRRALVVRDGREVRCRGYVVLEKGNENGQATDDHK